MLRKREACNVNSGSSDELYWALPVKSAGTPYASSTKRCNLPTQLANSNMVVSACSRECPK
eukprot:6010035-Alexandrium_andersonii.AAC.1